jgi:hypothetical protein
MPTRTKTVATLQFSSQILGLRAARRMSAHQTTEALRRYNLTEGIVTQRPLNPGEKLEIYLDGRLVGNARLNWVERVRWGVLNLENARRQGFESQQSLRDYLQRTGFRLDLLDQLVFFRIRWTWTRDDDN